MASLFAVTAPGLEAIAERELAALGLGGVAEPGGVAFEGGADALHRSHLWLRTASRVLVRVAEFHAASFHELERHARRLPFGDYLGAGATARLRVTCRRSRLYHSGAVAERIGEALAAAGFVVQSHQTPTGAGDEDDADAPSCQLFVVRLHQDVCRVSADASGALLHRRGWRQALGKAPLRETLAAALLQASGWDGRAPLVDPLCGSGTIAVEAALQARRIAPGLARRFRFMEWPGFDAARWSAEVERARAAALPPRPAPIFASDRDAGAIAAARANAGRAGVGDDITFAVRPLSALVPPVDPGGPGWLVTNPPYGVRVGERCALRDLYAALGQLARRALPGWTVCLIAPDRALDSATRLPLAPLLATRNGGLPVRVLAGVVPAAEKPPP